MAKRVIERSEVFDAARRLEAEGGECNAHQIWNMLGKRGSFTTIKNDLKVYLESDDRESLTSEAQVFDVTELMPDDMPQLVRKELFRLAQSLHHLHAQTRKEAEAEFTPSLNILIEKNSELQNEVTEVNKIAEFATDENERLTLEVDGLVEERDIAVSLNEDLTKTNQTISESLGESQEECQKLTSELHNVKSEHSALTEINQTLQAQVADLSATEEQLSKELAVLQRDQAEAKTLIEDLQLSLTDKNQKLKEISTQLTSQNQHAATLGKELAESQEALSDLKSQNSLFQYQISESERRHEIVSEKNHALAQELATSNASLAAVTAQKNDAVATKIKLEDQHEKLNIARGESQARITHLEAEVESCRMLPHYSQVLESINSAGLLSLCGSSVTAALEKLGQNMHREKVSSTEQEKVISYIKHLFSKETQ